MNNFSNPSWKMNLLSGIGSVVHHQKFDVLDVVD